MNDDPIAIFLVEAGEMLDQVEQGLLDLGEDMSDRSLIDSVFRALHTLKGSGAMFGFDRLAGFTHHCETAFDRVRKGEVAVTPELIAAVLAAQDHMRILMDNPQGDHDGVEAELLGRLADAVGERAATVDSAHGNPATAMPPPVAGQSGWRLTFRLPEEVAINGTNPLGLLDELRELAPATVTVNAAAVPALDQLKPMECHLVWTVDLNGPVERQAIEDVFIFVTDGLDLVLSPLGEPAADDHAPTAAASAVPTAAPTSATPPDPPPQTRAAPKAVESVRVPADRLDVLMDRVGELVIAQSRLSEVASNARDLGLRSISEEIQRLSNELRDTMMVLRMVPVGTVFGKFRRLVHDVARETGKEIDFATEGEATEVDKTVIERLSDPLVHLIRNSCDHGVETPDVRQAAGKPPAGRVTVIAEQIGSEIVITVRDDGRGMNRAAIRAKAEANGLVTPSQSLTDQDLLQMIFRPGFSTAAQITNLSGRGVGMDVVKQTIESLRGTIEVQSETGAGASIILRIPQTLAIIEGLLVRVGAGRYVIPLASVEECLELSAQQDLRSEGHNFMTLRDRLVPFLRLRQLFDTGTGPEKFQKVVVVATGGARVGLVVDQIIGSHQTVIKGMSPLHRNAASFVGATILGDGGVALILDVAQLVSLGQHTEEPILAAG